MARTLIVSDRQNSFFTANNIKVGTQIPTTGTYSKGDIIVNIGNNTATEAMWICVEAGTPGTWEVVGAGAGGGGSLVSINESVFVNEPVREVSLGDLSGKISTGDKLIVHFNSTHLMEGIDYEVHSTGTKIVKLTEGSWNESGETNALFAFELLKNVSNMEGDKVVMDTKLTSIVNNVILNGPKSEVEIGVSGFDKNNDMLLVFKNGVIMVEGVDYNISSNSQSITSIGDIWNQGNIEDYGITFVVFKEIARYDGTGGNITMNMLGSDVKNTINSLISITETNAANIAKNTEDINNKEVDVDLSSYQEKTDNSLSTSNKTIVGAINELFQNANNGKELIASAIGEPLSSGDTFNAMSNDINSLLSTFKTNMMKNGVTVERGDKFKALIDKIATLSDSEGKGIQYATGQGTPTSTKYFKDSVGSNVNLYYIEVNNLTFKPSIIMLSYSDSSDGDYTTFYSEELAGDRVTLAYTRRDNISAGAIEDIIDSSSCTINSTGFLLPASKTKKYTWIAIGVGEEDTTLRDSLANILEDKGVDVSPEDDMATLIGKVDSISSGGLDIISATSLPSTGKENQICVITDSPVTNYEITPDHSLISSNVILLHQNHIIDSNNQLVTVNSGNITYKYYFDMVSQAQKKLNSYYYTNGAWVKLTNGMLVLVEDGTQYNTDVSGGIYTANGITYSDGGGIIIRMEADKVRSTTFRNPINLGGYDNIEVTVKTGSQIYPGEIDIIVSSTVLGGTYSYSQPTNNVIGTINEVYDNEKTKIFSLANFQGTAYLGFDFAYKNYSAESFWIMDVKLY